VPVQAVALVDLSCTVVTLHPAQHGGLEPAETEVKRVAFHACDRESNAVRIAMNGKSVDHRPSWISEAEQLGHLVESLAGGIVARAPQQIVNPWLARFEQMRVPSADDQRKGGELDRMASPACFEDHRMNVPFNMV